MSACYFIGRCVSSYNFIVLQSNSASKIVPSLHSNPKYQCLCCGTDRIVTSVPINVHSLFVKNLGSRFSLFQSSFSDVIFVSSDVMSSLAFGHTLSLGCQHKQMGRDSGTGTSMGGVGVHDGDTRNCP